MGAERSLQQLAVWGVVGGAIALLALVGQGDAVVIGAVTGATYGLLALGLVLVYRATGAFNFAQGEFGTVAAYALWLGTTNGAPYLAAVALAIGAAVVLGLVTERVVVRPLAAAPPVTLLVATSAVAVLAIGVELWIGQARPRAVAPALERLDRLQLLGVYVSDQRLLIVGAVLGIGAGLSFFLQRTDLGLAVQAASQERVATTLAGIRVHRVSAVVWALAAALGGVAGILTAPVTGFHPGFLTLGPLVAATTGAVIGGFTSMPGAFAGGVLVGIAQSVATNVELLADVPGPQTATVFVLLVVVLLVRPQGLAVVR